MTESVCCHIISYSPRTDVKLAMAKAITNEFPRLENRDGEGYVSMVKCSSVNMGKHNVSNSDLVMVFF